MSCETNKLRASCMPAGRLGERSAGMRQQYVSHVVSYVEFRGQHRRHRDRYEIKAYVDALLAGPALGERPMQRRSNQARLAFCASTSGSDQSNGQLVFQRLATPPTTRTCDDHRTAMQKSTHQSRRISGHALSLVLDGVLSCGTGRTRLRFRAGLRHRWRPLHGQTGCDVRAARAQRTLVVEVRKIHAH